MTRLTAWRAVHPDLRSSRGFRWPWPGNEAVAPLPDGAEFTHGNPCPKFVGDGLCLAKTWRGAASGSIPAITCLLVEFAPADVLGEDDDKVRVSRCRVVDVFDAPALIRDGWCQGANLRGADLRGANLRGADLLDANLWGADLRDADLRGADLRGANLLGANLLDANLRGANLRDADLWGADLRDADLRGANLRDANLLDADLRDANLLDANLRDANLRGARVDRWTRWPDGFDPKQAGVRS